MPVRAKTSRPSASGDPLIEFERVGRAVLAMGREQRHAYMRSLPTAKKRQIEYALGVCNAHWRADPSTWLAHLDPSYTRYRYAALLGAAFRRAADGIEPRQIWTLPARLGKSTLGSQGGPGWALDRDPTSELILASYGKDLAVENAIAVRDLLTNHAADVRVRLRQDRRRQDRFVTTEGGGILAAGVGSRMTGFGAGGGLIGAGGGVVLDDLFKDWVAAHSAAERLRVWNWYLSVVRLRLNTELGSPRPAFIIHVTTRWHPDDVVGKMLGAARTGDGDTWTHYRLPHIAEAPSDDFPEADLLGRQPGEALEPLRFTADEVRIRQRALGSYLTAGMEQQRPAPEEGGELKRAWWQWGALPHGKPDDAVTSWDMKLKEKRTGDYQVGQAWLRYASTAWCVEQLRGQWNLPGIRAAIALMSIRHPEITKHLIENTGNGPEVIAALRAGIRNATVEDSVAGELGMSADERTKVEALLRRGIPGIIPVTPLGDKVARARAVSGYLEAGDVWLLDTAKHGWGLSLVNEAATFPGGRDDHDDQVDAWSQAIKYLLSGTAAVLQRPNPERRIELPRPGHVGPRRP